MNKGISFYWGYNTQIEHRAKLLGEIGFDCVITNADPKFNAQNGDIDSQIEILQQYNLKPSSLHMQYNSIDLPYFWTKGVKGRALEKCLIKDVKTAYKYGFKYVVTHVKGKPNTTGLNRLKRVLKVCKKLGVYIAIENTESTACFTYVFENIVHNNLKFCYDVGHNHCFNPDFDYLKRYGDKLVCVHLHDNSGVHDEHTLNKYGTIDWDTLARKLAKINYNGSLDYEIFMIKRDGETDEDVAREVYRQAHELEKLIEKYRK